MESKAEAKDHLCPFAAGRERNDNKAIREIAKQCVYVIRGCLREEEWLDAEEEFERIIGQGLRRCTHC